MGRKQCSNCGAAYEVGPDATETPTRCAYCNALLDERQAHGGPPGGGSKRTVVIAAMVAILVVGAAAGWFVVAGTNAPADRPAPSLIAKTPAPAPAPVVPSAPPPPEAPPPPRTHTVHDDIREFFQRVDGQLCLAGNLSRFGPFAGSVQLTAHPDGRVSQRRITMQPDAPKVTRCLHKAFGQGPTYRGKPVDVVYHFSGGRSPDGLQYRQGIELKGSAL